MPDEALPSTPIAVPTPAAAVLPPKTTAATTKALPPPPPATGLDSVTSDVFSLALVLGLVAAGAASMARKKWPAHVVLACEVCVSTWASAIAVAVWWLSSGLPVVKMTVLFFGSTWLAALVVCLLVLKTVVALTRLGTGG